MDVIYDGECEDRSGKLATAVCSRLNHSGLHEKRITTAPSPLMLTTAPCAMAEALRLSIQCGFPSSSLIALLQVTEKYEVEPSEAASICRKELEANAMGGLVSASVLARTQLACAGLSVSVLRYPFDPVHALPAVG